MLLYCLLLQDHRPGWHKKTTGTGQAWKQRTVLLLPAEKAKLNPKLLSAGLDFLLTVALVLHTECPKRIEGHELVCPEPLCLQFSHRHQQRARNALLQIRWMKDFPQPPCHKPVKCGGISFCWLLLFLLYWIPSLNVPCTEAAEGWAQGRRPLVPGGHPAFPWAPFKGMAGGLCRLGCARRSLLAYCFLHFVFSHLSVLSLCY